MADLSLYNFDEEKVKSKFLSIRDYLKTFVGKPGYNPFAWLADNVAPLEKEYKDGVRSQSLFENIMKIQLVEPKAKGAEHNIKNPPKQPQASGGDGLPITPNVSVSNTL